jgi:pimeloyl-ACP methyl ester carboxylesterase
LLRLLKGFVFCYLLICLVLSILQTKLIFPGAATQGQRASIHRPGANEELLELKTPEGERVVALFAAAKHEDPKSQPTIIFFYGNGMCLADCIGAFRDFRERGFNIILPDYLGYGMSGGKPGEKGVYAAADACWEYLVQSGRVDAKKIVPVGWSLGGAAAIDLASRKPAAAVVTLSAFTSMHEMGRIVMPLLPTGLLLQHHFRNDEKIRQIHVPVMIIHGEVDSIIPPMMASKLEQFANPPVTRVVIPGANHNDLFEVGGDEIFDQIASFINEHVR